MPSRPSSIFLGVEIGGTKLQIIAATSGGHIAWRWRGRVDQELGGVGICKQIEQAVAEYLEVPGSLPIAAAAIGFGGPVDRVSGRICKSHQIAGWENFPIREWFAKLVKRPVVVENDANTAALGEARCGAGQGADPMFYITLGSGVGGGLVVGGSVYQGRSPGEAEFGHLRLDRAGTTVESRCSGWAVDERIRQHARAEPASFLGRLTHRTRGGEARALGEALVHADPAARRILQELAGDLAFALSHVVHLMHPASIVIGGGLSLLGEPLRAAIENALPANVMDAFLPPPVVRLASLGEDAVPVGAVQMAMAINEV